MKDLARENRVELAEVLKLNPDGKNYKSLVDGPALCTSQKFKLVELSEEQKKEVERLEQDGYSRIVHVACNRMNVAGEIMDMEAYIYQNLYDEEDCLVYDGEISPHIHRVCAYVKNLTDDIYSEYGSVGIMNIGDKIVRVM